MRPAALGVLALLLGFDGLALLQQPVSREDKELQQPLAQERKEKDEEEEDREKAQEEDEELQQLAAADAEEEGKEEGRADGEEESKQEGIGETKKKDKEDGKEEGEEEGTEEALAEGMEEGAEEGDVSEKEGERLLGAAGTWQFVDLSGASAPDNIGDIPENSDLGYVDVLVGACGNKHIMAGATVPFGSVVASPWTDRIKGQHPIFYGMAHLGLSDTDWGALGVPRILPVLRGVEGRSLVLRSPSVKASPGLFEADLALEKDPSVAALRIRSSTTRRGAIHEIEWLNQHETGGRLLELSLKPTKNSKFVLASGKFHVESNRVLRACMVGTVNGSSTLYEDAMITLCLHAQFEEDFDALPGKQTMLLVFRNESSKVVARIGFSKTDHRHASNAFAEELDTLAFDEVVARSRSLWDQALGSVLVKGLPKKKTMFYTALYHSMLSPNLHSDSDGSFTLQKKFRHRRKDIKLTVKSVDKHHTRLHQTKNGADQYSTFASWATYRTLHPLLNLIRPVESRSFAESLLAMGEAWGSIPRAQLGDSATDTMEGDPGSIILGSAAMHGYVGAEEATQALNNFRSHRKRNDGRSCLEKSGCSTSEWSEVSAILEQAKADYCISHVADKAHLVNPLVFRRNRALRVFKLWDKEQCIFAPIVNESDFASSFHVEFEEGQKFHKYEGYKEGTPFQYAFAAEHDVETLSRAYGGERQLSCHIEYAFYSAPRSSRSPADGSLNMANELSFSTPYLAAKAGYPALTQRILIDVMARMFSPSCKGLPGSDDLGAMSSWIVFTMLGFYPLSPCSGEYVIGRPFLHEAELALEHGYLQIKSHYTDFFYDKYVATVSWNGETLERPVITLDQIKYGGLLEFWMSHEPAMGEPLICDEWMIKYEGSACQDVAPKAFDEPQPAWKGTAAPVADPDVPTTEGSDASHEEDSAVPAKAATDPSQEQDPKAPDGSQEEDPKIPATAAADVSQAQDPAVPAKAATDPSQEQDSKVSTKTVPDASQAQDPAVPAKAAPDASQEQDLPDAG